MKRKGLRILWIVLGVLALLVILIWPAAPLWARLGAEPVCISGSFPKFEIVSCQPRPVTPAVVIPHPVPTQTGQNPIPIIVDDDGSPDGMVALLYFLRNPLFDVKAVTISCGEAHPDLFAPHLQKLLAGLGRADIPVGVGRAAPLEGNNAFPEPWRQSSDAFWDLNLPQASVSGHPRPAADLIVDVLNGSTQPVVVFVSGNHTNLAEALRIQPGIAEHIRDVHIMGGSIYGPGNIKSDWSDIQNNVAEWNIWVDPVAADEVFASSLPLHLTPLDATNKVIWTQADADYWAASKTPAGALASDLLQKVLHGETSTGGYIWDLVAAINATDPDLCPGVSLAVDVLTAAGPDQGRTVITNQTANTTVCLNPDPEKMRGLAAAILSR